jgi:hypothetical protein
MSRNYLQRARAENIHQIQEWIRQAKTENKGGHVSVEALIRKSMLVLGCSKRTALEYIELIGDPNAEK